MRTCAKIVKSRSKDRYMKKILGVVKIIIEACNVRSYRNCDRNYYVYMSLKIATHISNLDHITPVLTL